MRASRTHAALLLALPILALSAATVSPDPTPPPLAEPIEAQGHIDAWRLESDGSVLFRVQRLKSKDTQDLPPLWFRASSGRHANTRVEVQVLDIILSVGAFRDDCGRPVTAVGRTNSTDRGQSERTAIPLDSLSYP